MPNVQQIPIPPTQPPLGNAFQTTAATTVQLSAEAGNFGDSACLGVFVQNPKVTPTGANQIDGVQVGWVNAPNGVSPVNNVVANVKLPITLMPGDPPIRVPIQQLSFLWVRPNSNAPFVNYWLDRGRTDGL